jgi:hypothetical protein
MSENKYSKQEGFPRPIAASRNIVIAKSCIWSYVSNMKLLNPISTSVSGGHTDVS